MPDYGLGRLPVVDPRDREHGMARLLARRRAVKPWRYWTPGPVLDQGSEPQCVGFAWRQWLYTSPTRTKDGPSAPEIYRNAQRVDEWPGEDYGGTSVRAGAKIMESSGRLVEYVWATGVGELRDWLLTRGPVVLGTNWHQLMFETNEVGFVIPAGHVVGGHAYLAIGYSDRLDAYRCINSWGSGWGQGGRFWVGAADMDNLLRADGEACAAIERKL